MGLIARFAAVAVAAAVAGWALVQFVYLPNHCNAAVTAADVATTAAERMGSDYQRLVRARQNLQRLAALRERCVTEVRVPVLIGANEELVGRPEDAVKSYTAALSVDRRPEIYVARAKVEMQLGRIDDAVESYAQAARFAPAVLDGIGEEEIRQRVRERAGAAR